MREIVAVENPHRRRKPIALTIRRKLTLNTQDKDEGRDEEMSAEAISNLTSMTGAHAVKTALKRASDATGAGFEILYNMARRESSLDPNAKAKTSSAAGLFQFIEQTWLGAVKNYGARHGLDAESAAITQSASGKFIVADTGKREEILNLRFDPVKAAALAGELIEENRTGLERRLGRVVDAGEVYAAHFLGLGGAARLLAAKPDAIAAEILPRAAAANRAVFYDGSRARTIGEVLASMTQSMGAAAGNSAAPTPPTIAETAVRAAALENAPAPQRAERRSSAPPVIEKKSASLPFATLSLAGGIASLKPLLSPLALSALQAIDPARLGRADSDDR
jgi:hypothetical protein